MCKNTYITGYLSTLFYNNMSGFLQKPECHFSQCHETPEENDRNKQLTHNDARYMAH